MSTGQLTPAAESRPLADVAVGDAGLAWAMVDASPDGLVMVDENGLIELVNHQTEVLFGYDRGELLGRPVEVLLPEELQAVHRAHRTRYRGAPEARAMGSGLDLLGRRRDGSEFPVEISLSPLDTDQGPRVIAAVRDISERAAGEAATQRIRRAIDSIQDAVYMIDPETGRFVYVNRGAEIQTGFTAEELLAGMTPAMFAPEFTRDELTELFQSAVDAQEPVRFETTVRPRSGLDFPVEVILEHPEVDALHQRAFVCIVRDITNRVEVENQLKASETRFRTAFAEGPVPMTIVAVENRTTIDANQAMVDLTGYSRDQLIGMSAADLAHADDIHPAARESSG